MTLFLFKPHVEGPEGAITTPDVVIDRVFLGGAWKPVNCLTSELELQVEDGETATPCYVLTALGGGVLIGPAVLLGARQICVARKTWRLRNLDDHIGGIRLNGQALDEIAHPADLIDAAGGRDGALPRGYMVVCAGSGSSASVELSDVTLGRSLVHKAVLVPVSHDRWGEDRPSPRYTVGPTKKEVQHFI